MAAMPTILIADRNSHVRKFIMRELIAEGYRVIPAATAESVLTIVSEKEDIALAIIDPDLPGAETSSFLLELANRADQLPILFHTHRRTPSQQNLLYDRRWCALVEKSGDSAERIKKAAKMLLSASSTTIS